MCAGGEGVRASVRALGVCVLCEGTCVCICVFARNEEVRGGDINFVYKAAILEKKGDNQKSEKKSLSISEKRITAKYPDTVTGMTQPRNITPHVQNWARVHV